MMENPVEKLYGSVKVKPEASPKRVARKWMMREMEKEISRCWRKNRGFAH